MTEWLGIPRDPKDHILWSQEIQSFLRLQKSCPKVVLDIDLPSELPRFLWTAAAEQGESC